jgi:microcystin-dependent protein
MAQPFIGEIRMFAGNFPPTGWMFCDGQTIPISQNDALFILLGTTYGGDGESTFNLPDLQGRAPVHQGTGPDGQTYQMGEKAGVETVTLTTQQIPSHNHAFLGSTNAATDNNPTGRILARSATVQYLTISPGTVAANANAVTPVGGSQPHENMQPYLCVNFIISLFGLFPSQT